MTQGRQPRVSSDLRRRRELSDQRANRVCAQEPSFDPPPCVEPPIGKHVTALRVGRQLHFVHSQEIDLTLERHRLNGTNPVARIRRNALLLAGHERYRTLAGADGELVVNLASEKAKRETNHPRSMRQQSLNGSMGLTGVSRAEESDERLTNGKRMGGHGMRAGRPDAESIPRDGANY